MSRSHPKDPKQRLSANDVYEKLKEIEASGTLRKYEGSAHGAHKMGRKKSTIVNGKENGQQSVEVVGCQCVVS